jgi:rhodanese-related sulfurtransferase
MKAATRHLLVLPLILLIAACGGEARDAASLTDIAQAAARQTDRVNVEDLASWIIEERKDFVLVDVRSGDDFARGHIADARNIPIAELLGEETLSGLPTDRKVIVYSNGSENGAKAATLLRVAGLDAHVVTGGYNAWHNRVLNPDIPLEELDGENPQVSAQRAFSCYFVGDREGSAERPDVKFVPPVYTEEEADDLEPLPPAGEESC